MDLCQLKLELLQRPPPLPRLIPNEFSCEEKIVVDDEDDDYNGDVHQYLTSDDDDDAYHGDDIDEYYSGYMFRFSCSVPSLPPTMKDDSMFGSSEKHSEETEPRRLIFKCRGRSVGVMVLDPNDKKHGDDDDEEQPMTDPFFFDDGYTLAGRTGFQVWAGSRLLLESLLYPLGLLPRQQQQQQNPIQSDPPRLVYWQKRILKMRLPTEKAGHTNNGKVRDDCGNAGADDEHHPMSTRSNLRILELGSGVGLVGTSLAALGHEVVLTDLPTLIKHSVIPNMKLNGYRHGHRRRHHRTQRNNSHGKESCQYENSIDEVTNPFLRSPPSWLSTILPAGQRKDDASHQLVFPIQSSNNRSENDSLGWMRAVELDWTKPLSSQILNARETLQDIDMIVASDCVWLTSMMDSLLDTVESIFTVSRAKQQQQHQRKPSFILSFQDRRGSNVDNENDNDGRSRNKCGDGSMFTTPNSVLQAIRNRGWACQCLSRRYTLVEAEAHEQHETNGTNLLRREVYVLEVLMDKGVS